MVACGEMGLYIYDISDLEQGQGQLDTLQIAWCDTPGKAEEVIIIGRKIHCFFSLRNSWFANY